MQLLRLPADVPAALPGPAGGHSHTFLYGTPAPAGQPQVPRSPLPLLIGSERESNAAGGPFPTNVLSGNKTIPITQALWGSR